MSDDDDDDGIRPTGILVVLLRSLSYMMFMCSVLSYWYNNNKLILFY